MIQVWGMTDVGLCRKENQDAYAVREHAGHTICVVCDGMGGPAGGRMASRIAVDTFVSSLEGVLTPEMRGEQLREASSWAAALANKAIREAAGATEEYANMGTTLVSAVTRRRRRRRHQCGRQPCLSYYACRDHPHHQGSLPGGEHGGPGGHHR